MSQFTSLTFGKSRLIPFTVLTALGQVDTTTEATPGSSSQSKVSSVINPANNREVLITGITPTPDGNVTVTVTALGHSDTYMIQVPTPPDQTSVVFGLAGPEF